MHVTILTRHDSGKDLLMQVQERFSIYGGVGYSIEPDENGEVSCSFSTTTGKIAKILAWLHAGKSEFTLTVQKWID